MYTPYYSVLVEMVCFIHVLVCRYRLFVIITMQSYIYTCFRVTL